jgi:hypothetical protein
MSNYDYMGISYFSPFRFFHLYLILILLLAGCKPVRNPSANESEKDSLKIRVVTERYSNGAIKMETTTKGNLRHGLTRNYRMDGRLMSEVNYADNVKQGISRDFYDNGKVRMEIPFQNGLKDGNAKWFYETGEIYRVTPYVKGKKEGVQMIFFKDGKKMAEVPYKEDTALPGLKEFDRNGRLLPVPSIILKEHDMIALQEKFILQIQLSDKSTNVTFYEGEISDWRNFPGALPPIPMTNGVGQLVHQVTRGTTVMRTINIIAIKKTELGNDLILQKKYNLAYRSR